MKMFSFITKKKSSYERWKAGEKIFKVPWVINYYENVTDENQHKYATIVVDRAILITGTACFLLGLYTGYVLWVEGII